MRKIRNLVRFMVCLSWFILIDMCYIPTATANNEQPVVAHLTDTKKTIKQDIMQVIKPCATVDKTLNPFSTRQRLSVTPVKSSLGFGSSMAQSYSGHYDYKDDPHILNT